MIEINETNFEGMSCVQLKNKQLSLWVTKDVGPRIIGLSLLGEENLLVVLPDAKILVDGAEDYSLRGGHRLWYAPEKPRTTYITDDLPVDIEPIKNGLKITQTVDQPTGIQKSWQVSLDEDKASITINHILSNLGKEAFELAPWAVTMLSPGGVGIIPLQTELDDDYGLLPNRQLTFWPYTQIKSKYLELQDNLIAVKANMSEGSLKVGAPNPIGWLTYGKEGTLFVKQTNYDKNAKYLDRGASSQIYCNPDVIELETLGPLVSLKVGESTEHLEIWQVYADGMWPDKILSAYQKLKD